MVSGEYFVFRTVPSFRPNSLTDTLTSISSFTPADSLTSPSLLRKLVISTVLLSEVVVALASAGFAVRLVMVLFAEPCPVGLELTVTYSPSFAVSFGFTSVSFVTTVVVSENSGFEETEVVVSGEYFVLRVVPSYLPNSFTDALTSISSFTDGSPDGMESVFLKLSVLTVLLTVPPLDSAWASFALRISFTTRYPPRSVRSMRIEAV